MKITEILDLNGHININSMSKPGSLTHMNSSVLEPVFLKSYIILSCDIQCTGLLPFIQFASTKTTSQILQQCMHDFKENPTILYSKLVTKNDLDYKSYDVRQCILTY